MRLNTELRVNLSNLEYNVDHLREIAPSKEIIFMVKANAYGHGLLEITKFAFEELGIKRFGCASLGEAMKIREAFPKMTCEIFVFSDTNLEIAEFHEYYLDHNILPVLHSIETIQFVLENSEFRYLPLIIKFDTGMHRLGLDPSEVEDLISLLKKHGRSEIFHLMTHFSHAHIRVKPGSKLVRQSETFCQIKSEIQSSGISIVETSTSNSGAIEQKVGLDQTHIRPGLMLYGPRALMGKNNDLWKGKTISSFKTQVIHINPVKKGMPIGYGGHVCSDNGYVAMIPVGYGDGILTFYSGAKFMLEGVEAKILGRVNMDMTALFIKERPANLKIGSEFFIWDDKINDIDYLSMQLKTIPYQLFLAVTSRVPRHYYK